MKLKWLMLAAPLFALGLVAMETKAASAACSAAVNIPLNGLNVNVDKFNNGIQTAHGTASAAGTSGNADLVWENFDGHFVRTTLQCQNHINGNFYNKLVSDHDAGGSPKLVSCDTRQGGYDYVISASAVNCN